MRHTADTKKAFGYLRVSGKGQLEGSGLDRQEDTIRDYAQKHGYDVVRIFREEGVSGTLDEADRPAFQSMLAEILKDSVRVVIVEGLDRLAREYRIQESLLIYLASKGITLVSARTEEDVTSAMLSDPMKKALVQIQGIFAELEKSLLVKKLRVAREKARKDRGKCEGQKGYTELDPELVARIKRLRRLPFKGATRKRSFREIAEILNGEGRTTKHGGKFTATNVAMIYARL
jgi:DNA invertase Pin-like site-specific DNA recombinase